MSNELNSTCNGIGYQAVEVSVSVSVIPFSKAEPTITKCCGIPVVKKGSDITNGIKNGKCDFVISQKIIVEIPVSFGADAIVGDTFINDIKASNEEIKCEDITETQIQ